MKTRILITLFLLTSTGFAQLPVTDAKRQCKGRVMYNDPGPIPNSVDGIVGVYKGPLAECPEVKDFVAKLPDLRRKAIAYNLEMLGIPETFKPGVLIEVYDHSPLKPYPMFIPSRMMVTAPRIYPDRIISFVEVYTNALVSKRIPSEQGIIHEINHAILKEYLGYKKSRALAAWFQEGVASWCANERETRIPIFLSLVLGRAKTVEEAEKSLKGLVGCMEKTSFLTMTSASPYAEYLLTIEYLDSCGEGALKKAIAGIKDDLSLDEALAKASGMEIKEFRKKAQEYVIRECAKVEGGLYKVYVPLLQKLRSGVKDENLKELPESIAEAEALLEDHGEKYFALNLRCWIAYAKSAIGEHAEVVKMLKKDLDGPIHGTPFVTRALLCLAKSSMELKDYETARECSQRILWGHAFVQYEFCVAEALVFLAKCSIELKDYETARECCQKLLWKSRGTEFTFAKYESHIKMAQELLANLDARKDPKD